MDGNGHMTGVTVDVASNRGVPIAHVVSEPQHIELPVAAPQTQEETTEQNNISVAEVSVSEDVRPTSEEVSVMDSAAALTLSTLTRPTEEETASSDT